MNEPNTTEQAAEARDVWKTIAAMQETIDRLTSFESSAKESVEILRRSHAEEIGRLTAERDEAAEGELRGYKNLANIATALRLSVWSEEYLASHVSALQADLAKAREENARLKEDNKRWEEVARHNHRVGDAIADNLRRQIGVVCAERDQLRSELSAANARAEKCEVETRRTQENRDRIHEELLHELETTKAIRAEVATLKGERDMARATALGNNALCEKVCTDRDELTRRLAEAEAKLEKDKYAREEWATIIKRWAELCIDRDAALAASEKPRAVLESISRRGPIMGSTGDYRQGQLDALQACREVASEVLSLTPPESLRALKLKVAEAAFKEPLEAQFHSDAPNRTASIHGLWLASKTYHDLTQEMNEKKF